MVHLGETKKKEWPEVGEEDRNIEMETDEISRSQLSVEAVQHRSPFISNIDLGDHPSTPSLFCIDAILLATAVGGQKRRCARK